jgi:hypothetical protein
VQAAATTAEFDVARAAGSTLGIVAQHAARVHLDRSLSAPGATRPGLPFFPVVVRAAN